jgi:hypothetical protein
VKRPPATPTLRDVKKVWRKGKGGGMKYVCDPAIIKVAVQKKHVPPRNALRMLGGSDIPVFQRTAQNLVIDGGIEAMPTEVKGYKGITVIYCSTYIIL